MVALGCENDNFIAEFSRICQRLDMQVHAFLNRPLEFSCYPYLYLDATYLHGRDPARKQVISRAVIVAVGIGATGQREVLGSRWATARTRRSGPPSCGGCASTGSQASS